MDYAQAVAQVLAARISDSRTVTARGTVTAVTTTGFVTFTDAIGNSRKGVWVGTSPAIFDVITYLDEGRGFPLVLGTSGSRGWVTVSPLQNSWVNWGTPFETAGFRKIGDIVYLKGVIKDGTVPSTAFTVPFQPLQQTVFPVHTATSGLGSYPLGRVDVDVDGHVIVQQGGNGYVGLSGLLYSTV